MPSNTHGVPGNTAALPNSEGNGRERSERLRARRDAAGLAQVSGWVPKERRAYAREVIAALSRGTNSLPPDPEQAAALEAARAGVEAARAGEAAARAELVSAKERAQALAAELAMTRAKIEALQGREKAAQEAADALRSELAGIRGRGGWRGVLLRLAGS